MKNNNKLMKEEWYIDLENKSFYNKNNIISNNTIKHIELNNIYIIIHTINEEIYNIYNFNYIYKNKIIKNMYKSLHNSKIIDNKLYISNIFISNIIYNIIIGNLQFSITESNILCITHI
jgi:hypothetical protein